MNKFILYILIIILCQNQTFGQNKKTVSLKKYNIENYSFSIEVPSNWESLFPNIFDSVRDKDEFHSEWYLPRHFSKSKKRKSFNAVTITAFKFHKYNTVEDFLNSSLPKTDTNDYYQTKYLSQEPDSISKNALISYMTVSGFKHKLKTYYVINKQFSYFICLYSVADIYDFDVAAFDKLYNSIQFY